MPFMRRYNTLTVTGTTAIRLPIIKRAVVDFAVGADWTPVAGDVKIAIDGAAPANVTNLPTAVASGNGAYWEFVLTAAELTCKQAIVTIVDAATKAVEDQCFLVETFGNASAMYVADLSLANLPANVTQLLGTAWLTPGTAGTPDVNVKLINAVATTSVTAINANQGTTQPVNFTGAGASALAKSDMVDVAGAAVSTATAQIGVNAVQLGAAPVTATTSVTIPAAATLATTTGAVGSVTGAVGSVTGAVGSVTGLTASNLDATISSRMTSYTQPTGFLAATFPTGTVANTTNITAGTITTATNVTTVNGLAANVITAAAIADAAIDNATFAADTGQVTIRSNTAQAGSATTITLDASASAVNNFYNNTLILLTGGTGAGQARFITAYDGTTKVATVATWATNPAVATTFAIIPFDAVAGASAPTTAQISTAVWTDLLASSDFATASSIGKLLKDDINVALSTLATPTNITAGTLTTVMNLTTNNDKTGYGLSAAAVQAIWDALTSALTTVGSIGKKLADWTIGTAQTGDSFARLGAPAGASVSADIASIKTDTGTTIPGRLPAALTGAGNMKADTLAINGNTTSAAVLAILNGATVVYQGTVTGAVTTTTLIDSGLTQADVDWWKGRIIIFTSVITLQATDITAFDPVTDKLTFTALTQAPTGATYVII